MRSGHVTKITYQGTEKSYVFNIDFPVTGGIDAYGPRGLRAHGACYQTLVRNIHDVVRAYEEGTS